MVGNMQRCREIGGEGAPVRHNGVGVLPEGLDETEDVVPSPAVQSHGVRPQLPQDLVHLERRRQGLYQHCGLHAQQLLDSKSNLSLHPPEAKNPVDCLDI